MSRTISEDMGSLRTSVHYAKGSAGEQRAAAKAVCGIAARLHPDTAAKDARTVLEALGLAPYSEGEQQ